MSEKYNIPEQNSLDSMEGVEKIGEIKPKQIFVEPNINEPSELTTERENKFARDFIEINGEQNTAEWNAFFEKINFPKLRKIFFDYVKQFGITEKGFNFLGSDRLFSTKNTMNSGEYFPFHNAIKLGPVEPQLDVFVKEQETIDNRRKEIENEFGSLDILRLATLIHEETHAISQRECSGIYGFIEDKEDKHRFSQTGFNQEYRTRPQSGDYMTPYYYEHGINFFSALNEALTERIARKIVLKYIGDSDFEEGEHTDIYRQHCESNLIRHYKSEINLIERIVQRVSDKTNYSHDELWKILEKGYFDGERFEDGEIKDIFERVFGSKFIGDLAGQSPHYSSADFIKKYNL